MHALSSAYNALNKLDSLEYIELDYFTMKGCRDAGVDADKSISHDTLTFMQLGDTFALRPLATQRPSKHIRRDEDLSWEEMLNAKNNMLHFMAKSKLWPPAHAEATAAFFLNLELHPRKLQKNGKRALMIYQGRVCCEWFDSLKRQEGFNIKLIQDELLHSYADELNDTIRDMENVTRDREIDQVIFRCCPRLDVKTTHLRPDIGP